MFQGAWFDPDAGGGDADAGLYLHAARWRDPGTGAFLSGDPAGLAFDPPNVHWFARGNPAIYSDPTGLGAYKDPPGVGGLAGWAADAAVPATGCARFGSRTVRQLTARSANAHTS